MTYCIKNTEGDRALLCVYVFHGYRWILCLLYSILYASLCQFYNTTVRKVTASCQNPPSCNPSSTSPHHLISICLHYERGLQFTVIHSVSINELHIKRYAHWRSRVHAFSQDEWNSGSRGEWDPHSCTEPCTTNLLWTSDSTQSDCSS